MGGLPDYYVLSQSKGLLWQKPNLREEVLARARGASSWTAVDIFLPEDCNLNEARLEHVKCRLQKLSEGHYGRILFFGDMNLLAIQAMLRVIVAQKLFVANSAEPRSLLKQTLEHNGFGHRLNSEGDTLFEQSN